MPSWGFSFSGVGPSRLALLLIQLAYMRCIPTSFHYTTALPTPGVLLFIQDTHHPTRDAKGKKIHFAYHPNLATSEDAEPLIARMLHKQW